MNLKELREKNIKELQELLVSKRNELEDVNQALITGKEKNTAKARGIRRDIARISTVVTEKEKNA